MEKKTIGKFISALRKAHGMTQKELGEKLFVSDKTVSRWECDECTPELSLIPSIAEIFGITTDELLRGERNNPDREVSSEDVASSQKAKSDKQFKLMLHSRKKKFINLSLISIGLTIVGLIAAMICNLGFSKGLLGFCLASIFFVAATICQICFTVSSRLLVDEEEVEHAKEIKKANTDMVFSSAKIFFSILLTFAFCLPMATMIDGANFGLVFEDWIGYGLLTTAIVFVVVYVIYQLFICNILYKRGLVVFDEMQQEEIKRDKKLLIKLVCISIAIALVLGVCIIVWDNIGLDVGIKEMTFDNCADFKAFMENDYQQWYNEGYSCIDENGNVIFHVPIQSDGVVVVYPPSDEKDNEYYYPQKKYAKIYNSKGDVICEYYYNPNLYAVIQFTESADDKMPVTVITNQAHYNARVTFQTVESILYILIVVDFVIAIGIYIIKTNQSKKKS